VRSTGIIGLLLSTTSLAAADPTPSYFTANYGEWRALSSALKKGYAAGAFDMLMRSGSLGAYDSADERGVSNCALSAGFTPGILTEMIDRRYAQHSEEWS
jgi:hypothetical protein